MLVELGRELHSLRKRHDRTLQAVADDAKISAAYLQKLERGQVNAPSPHVLRRLAAALDVAYLRLMALAGYLTEEETETGPTMPSALEHASLSAEEWRAVLAFVRFLEEERDRGT